MAVGKIFKVPNLCKNTAVLSIVVLVEFWAIVVALLAERGDFVTTLGSASLYSQWLALSCALVICLQRQRLNKLADRQAILSLVCIISVIFLLVELTSQWVLQGMSGLSIDGWRLAAHFIITMFLTFGAIRLFSLASILEQRNKAEVESRVQALQSRIRPHFLFNSLNTIAELTATEPERAEEAIDSLSQLFRASLETERRFHSLDSELNLCRRYVDLEKWRLEDRLTVDWQIQVNRPRQITVPKLILQPLIENAIVHGVQPDGSIRVLIDLRETRQDISIMVENTRGAAAAKRVGHGIAVENIRERLFVLYDDRQTFRVRQSNDSYSVLMRFPKLREASILESNSTMISEP